MTKNNQDFKDFLRDEVNLNQSRLDVLHERVRAVNSYLKDNLTGLPEDRAARFIRSRHPHQACGR